MTVRIASALECRRFDSITSKRGRIQECPVCGVEVERYVEVRFENNDWPNDEMWLCQACARYIGQMADEEPESE